MTRYGLSHADMKFENGGEATAIKHAPSPPTIDLIETGGWSDYRLIDSGGGRKLERFGSIVTDRPEPQAMWRKRFGEAEWARAHAVFSAAGGDAEKGKWRIDKKVPSSWTINLHNITMLCRLQGLWHLGLFPEQLPHWQWMLKRISQIKGERPRVLNLFAYTGAASLLAAAAGAEVTHVDASKKAIQWAKDNQTASKLDAAPIRWILDDASKFVAREVRRGRTYHVILLDPPKFGRGPDGEVWDLFTSLPPLLSNCSRLLTREHASLILTVYAIRASSLAFDQLVREAVQGRGGSVRSGELAIRAENGGHAVPASLFTRWSI